MSTPSGRVIRRGLRRDAVRNRQRVLAAAREEFAARGLAVALDDIARHAGVGVGTLYRRFASKEALIEALFEDRLDEIVALAEQAVVAQDSWRALVDFLTATAELHAGDRGMREMLLAAGYGGERLARIRERLREPVRRLIARAQADGHLRADVAPEDVPLVQLMIGTVAQYSADVDPQLWRRYLTLLLDGMRAQAATGPLPRPALDPGELGEAMHQWRPWCR